MQQVECRMIPNYQLLFRHEPHLSHGQVSFVPRINSFHSKCKAETSFKIYSFQNYGWVYDYLIQKVIFEALPQAFFFWADRDNGAFFRPMI